MLHVLGACTDRHSSTGFFMQKTYNFVPDKEALEAGIVGYDKAEYMLAMVDGILVALSRKGALALALSPASAKSNWKTHTQMLISLLVSVLVAIAAYLFVGARFEWSINDDSFKAPIYRM